MTGAFGRSSPDLGDFQPPTLETLPEAVARNVAIAWARTRARIMAVVKAERPTHAGTGLSGGGLTAARMVNYPTEWWHWSHGDRYWAHATGADATLYGSDPPGAPRRDAPVSGTDADSGVSARPASARRLERPGQGCREARRLLRALARASGGQAHV